MRRALPLLVLAAAAPSLPAQLSGTFLIDPMAGPPNYTSFQSAVYGALINGVSGPVEFLVAPGVYNESVLIPPISGTSSTSTISFRALNGPGSVQLVGTVADTITLLATSGLRNGWLVFDGLDFVSAPGAAIYCSSYVEGLEIKNCTFGPNHRGSSYHAIIYASQAGTDAGWNVHHNRFTFPDHTSRTSYGVYLSNGGEWSFHDNVVDLNGCDHGLYMINENRRLDRVYNNVFYGSLRNSTSSSADSVTVIKADISNYNNDFVHNTFYVTIPGSGCIIVTRGLGGSSPATNRIYGNVFALTGGGTCIVLDPSSTLPNPYFGDGNVFWAPSGEIGRSAPNSGTPYTTLAAWQTATGMDAGSVVADPLFRNPAAMPPDLRVAPGSPTLDRAVNTPGYVVEDLLGRFRDSAPDAGAYESTGFAFFGRGCAGTGGMVPTMGFTGTVSFGSTFTVDVSNTVPTAPAAALVALSRLPAPISIGGGCDLLALPALSLPSSTSASGVAAIPVLMTTDLNLLGLDVFFQWAVIDPGSGSSFGIVLSDGGALQV